MSSVPSWQRSGAMVIAGVVLLLAVVSARMLLGARAEQRRAEQAKQPRERIRHLRRAMAYYLPGNPYVAAAKASLRSEAQRAASAGDATLALHAYHELRSAILRLRGLYQPYADDLPAINAEIVRLSAKQDGAALPLKDRSGQRRLSQRLAEPPEPKAGWAAIGLLGFLIWTGGALALLVLCLRPDGGILPSRFWPGVGVIVCGLLLFFAGMALA